MVHPAGLGPELPAKVATELTVGVSAVGAEWGSGEPGQRLGQGHRKALVGLDQLRSVLGLLGELALGPATARMDDATRVEVIAMLESVGGAAAGAQARAEVELYQSQVAVQERQGVRTRSLGRGVADQIGLARRISGASAARELSVAHGLVTELPVTFRLMATGKIGAFPATVFARRTAALSRPERAAVDADLGPRLPGWSTRQVQAEADRAVYRIDPAGAVKRAGNAAKDRRVSLRPAPDCMAMLTALLPVAQGVAVLKQLDEAASSVRTTGADGRSRAQVMADTLVERVTGQAHADQVPIEVSLVLTPAALTGGCGCGGRRGDDGVRDDTEGDDTEGDDTEREDTEGDDKGVRTGERAEPAVLDRDDRDDRDERDERDEREEPAVLERYGPIPAGLARALIAPTSTDGGAFSRPGAWSGSRAADDGPVWVRRVLVDPDDGTVTGIEATRHRLGSPALADRVKRWFTGQRDDQRDDQSDCHGDDAGGSCDGARRVFTGLVRRLILARDQSCRTPYCDAPIRHIDHIQAVSRGGSTTVANGQGVCERFNYVKEIPGWHVRVIRAGHTSRRAHDHDIQTDIQTDIQNDIETGHGADLGPPGGPHEIEITTPTGHTYRSSAPPALGPAAHPAAHPAPGPPPGIRRRAAFGPGAPPVLAAS